MTDSKATIPTFITSEYLQELLQDFFHDDSVKIQHFHISSGSTIGDGYLGQIYRIQVDYTKQNQNSSRSIIAKAAPITEMIDEFDPYKEEVNMFETLPLLDENLRFRNETELFHPYLYKMDVDNKIIFMEDLKPEGYVVYDRTKPVDLDHALLVMKATAKFHASSYILLKKNPDLKKNYLDYVTRDNGHFLKLFLEKLYAYLLRFLDQWSINEEDKQIFRSLQSKILDLFWDNFERNESSLNAIAHGDFSVKNIMFKYVNGKVNSVKLIDFQLCHFNSIAIDLHYFIFSGVKGEVIVEHLDKMLSTYYETFVKIVGDEEGITMETIRSEFFKKLGIGFIFATVYRPAILTKNVLDVMAFIEGRDAQTNTEMLENKEFMSEVAKMLPLFKKHGVFK